MPGLQPIPLNITGEEWKDAKPQLLRALNYLIKDMYDWIGRIQGVETASEPIALGIHTHQAADQGGDYAWADITAAQAIWLAAVAETGSDGTVTVITAMREGGDPLKLQYKSRDLTIAEGLITTIGAESAWTNVEFGT